MTHTPPTDGRNDQFFDRLNLDEVPLSEAQVYGGEGLIRFGFLRQEGQSSGSCRLTALVEIPGVIARSPPPQGPTRGVLPSPERSGRDVAQRRGMPSLGRNPDP